MTQTARFTTRLSTLARRPRTSGRPGRSSLPRHEALALGLGCGRTRLAARPEWR